MPIYCSRPLRRCQPLPQRVAGIDLFESLLQLANERGYSLYLLGATLAYLGLVEVTKILFYRAMSRRKTRPAASSHRVAKPRTH